MTPEEELEEYFVVQVRRILSAFGLPERPQFGWRNSRRAYDHGGHRWDARRRDHRYEKNMFIALRFAFYVGAVNELRGWEGYAADPAVRAAQVEFAQLAAQVARRLEGDAEEKFEQLMGSLQIRLGWPRWRGTTDLEAY